jgi:hypothetical protein
MFPRTATATRLRRLVGDRIPLLAGARETFGQVFQPEAAPLKKKERSVLQAVQPALQHLSGVRHFVQGPRCDHDPKEPT